MRTGPAPARTAPTTPPVLLVLLVLLALSLVACGDGDDARSGSDAGTEPVTARAIAAVAADHLDRTPARGEAEADDFGFTRPPTGASLLVASRPDEVVRLSVSVGDRPDASLPSCSGDWADVLDGCVSYEGGTLMWQEEEPEEDPGIVYFARRKGEAMVLVELGGPVVHGDPREHELPVPVSTLAAIAGDGRLDVLTTREAIEAGEGLSWFRGPDGAEPGDDVTAG